MSYKGSCLCGCVCYEISEHIISFQYCYCSRCRRTTGSAHASNLITAPDQFQWTKGSDLVGRFEPKDAKHYATGFCKNCGSNLPWLTQSRQAMIIPAGTLDESFNNTPERNIFWGDKAPWYQLPTTLDTFNSVPGKSEVCRLDD